MKIADRFYRQNRDPIFNAETAGQFPQVGIEIPTKSKSIPDFSGSIFNRDHHRDYHLQIVI